MPVAIESLFPSDSSELTPAGSRSWNRKIFERAYYDNGGPFHNVCQRLQRGFSVLVYLPGNCMAAAAEVARVRALSGGVWTDLGKPDGKEDTVADVWRKTTSLFESIKAWLSGGHTPPNVIFHNLDLLGDGRGGLEASNEAKTALFYLIDITRSGVVLGLSDRDAGELPEAIRRVFAEEISLDTIPVERFKRLIPRQLGERLDRGGGIPDGAAWLIASRLRWIDPIRAVKIMDAVANEVDDGDLDAVLAQILAATQTVEFLDPRAIEDVQHDPKTGGPSGFDYATVDLLDQNVVKPFRSWAHFSGSEEACKIEIRRLPPGLILYGPPGTGKTSLARWIARSIGLPVRQVRAADLKRPDYGQTERLVRELFRTARRAAPCVIMLDDADDLLPIRSEVTGTVASAEIGIVNAFLQEWEGFGGRIEGVLVILTTNRYQKLDQAARSRVPLPLHLRIPYPLDREQVKQIMTTVAASYGFGLSDEVREQLVDCFMRPLAPTNADVSTREGRMRLNKNLFAPRDIEAAMRLLAHSAGGAPTTADVKLMEDHLKRIAEETAYQVDMA